MINKLLGAAAMAAIALAVAPAFAAKMGMAGCSDGNLAKTESAIEVSADGNGKWDAEKEITAAQASILDGKMGACAMHLSKAQRDISVK